MTNIIELGDLRITRARRQYTAGCQHKRFTVDPNGDIVTCNDCDKQISSHFALLLLVDEWDRAQRKLADSRASHAAAMERTVVLRAAQRVQSAWRSRTMVPTCPHCGEGIFPEDGFGGSAINKEMALRRLQAIKDREAAEKNAAKFIAADADKARAGGNS